MDELSLRRHLILTACALVDKGLSPAKSGNVSVRYKTGCLITPSGMRFEELQTQDIVFVDGDGSSAGIYAPSSEWQFHLDLYLNRSDIEAIVHTHSTYGTALACTGREIPAFHYMVAAAGGDKIPCAEYATFGTKALSDNILSAMSGYRACLLGNHGCLAVGKDLMSALQLAEELESIAAQYVEVLKIGGGHVLSSEQMQAVHQQFSGYGSARKSDD